MSLYEKKRNPNPVADGENAENRLNARTRACTWLILSVVVFLCSIVTCGALIARSAKDNGEREVQEVHVEDIKYVANNTELPTDAENGSETNEQKLKAPESVYDASLLNVLVVGYDEKTEQTDAMIIVSIDTERGQPSMLSIPRDTYISGNYDVPKINRVYAENGSRGIDALKESIENMVGFRLDHYVVFDSKGLSEVLELTDGVEFEIPTEPMYHDLLAGEQKLSGEKAFGLFSYREDYTDVETEPYRVQRDFLGTVLDTLLADQDKKFENAEAICNAVDTDLEASELAYLADVLKNARFAASFSRALPGGEITARGEAYYQVEPVEACEILNGHFNPTGSDLSEYDVHFRQLQGDSGEGELSDYGFGGPKPTTNPDLTQSTDEPTEETEDETDENTEEPSSEDENNAEPTDGSEEFDENESTEPTDSSDEPESTDGDE